MSYKYDQMCLYAGTLIAKWCQSLGAISLAPLSACSEFTPAAE